MTNNGIIKSFDDRRNIAAPGDFDSTLIFCVEHFIEAANKAIASQGAFYVALSGGSTPKAIFEALAEPIYSTRIDWKKVHLFWSDERCVPPYDPSSNYRMAMDAGFSKIHIPAENIHRMQAEGDPEEAAVAYEKLIESKIHSHSFDLVMLGMGDDGHTASLFPKTHGLHSQQRLVVANFLPDKGIWRITFTFELINQAKQIAIYVLGKSKAAMLHQVLNGPYLPDDFPVQKVGTPSHKALFIVDAPALALIQND